MKIWDRVKFNEKCITDLNIINLIRSIGIYILLYVQESEIIIKEQLNSDMMSLAMYCNTFVYDLYTHD